MTKTSVVTRNTTTSPWTRRTSTKRSMDATAQARAGLQKRIEDTYASSIQSLQNFWYSSYGLVDFLGHALDAFVEVQRGLPMPDVQERHLLCDQFLQIAVDPLPFLGVH